MKQIKLGKVNLSHMKLIKIVQKDKLLIIVQIKLGQEDNVSHINKIKI